MKTASASAGLTSQRVDKWLWHARIVRTRSAATALAAAGYVRINGTKAAASQPVSKGDVVTVALDRSVQVLAVEGFCERRGGAGQARGLYSQVKKSAKKSA